MSNFHRRRFLKLGLGATAAGTGLVTAAAIAKRYGLVPPTKSLLYAPGDTLTYASQRLLTTHALAREFSREQISKSPFANGHTPAGEEYKHSQAGSFANWKLAVKGLVARPQSFSLADIRSFPARTQITQLVCEEGWSYIAEWKGALLADLLHQAEVLPKARYVVYYSRDNWTDAVDMADALHPQTLVTYGMNGEDLPIRHGGPLRMRVPRQLGYKSVKFMHLLVVTDTLKGFVNPGEYSWYAGV